MKVRKRVTRTIDVGKPDNAVRFVGYGPVRRRMGLSSACARCGEKIPGDAILAFKEGEPNHIFCDNGRCFDVEEEVGEITRTMNSEEDTTDGR